MPSGSLDAIIAALNSVSLYANEGGGGVHERMGTQTHAPNVVLGVDIRPEVGFEEFFRAQSNRLFRALIVVTGDPVQAEELTQEAFTRLWAKWDRVSRMSDPAGYLYRTALNGYFDVRRRALRAAKAALTPAESNLLESVEARDELARALLRLPRRQRAALIVTEVLGYDSTAAAKILGIRPGTVRRQVSLAKQRLRQESKREEANDE